MSVVWGTQYGSKVSMLSLYKDFVTLELKTNLRLAANRLKLLQKKKTELALKARTEIADFLVGKTFTVCVQ